MTQDEKKEMKEKIDAGVKAAIAEAVERHRRLGQPIVVWRDGKAVTLQPEEITPNNDIRFYH